MENIDLLFSLLKLGYTILSIFFDDDDGFLTIQVL
jgi:hypothetical protein